MGKNNASTATDITDKSINPLGGFLHHQRFLHGCKKASNCHQKSASHSLQEKRFGKNRTQIHRYLLQDWSWSLPNYRREKELHGTTQEGQVCCRWYHQLKSLLHTYVLSA